MISFTPGQLVGSNTAISADAATLEERLRTGVDTAVNSVLAQRLIDMYVALLDACTMAVEPNWDGDGAQPITAGALRTAEGLILTMPANVPVPEIAVHPDGQIGFDWIVDRNHMFSMAAGESGHVAYAAMAGGVRDKGTSRFRGTFPPSARFHLACVLKDAGQLNA